MQSLDREVKKLYVELQTDAAGDVVTSTALGTESVEHASNVYTITLEDRYVRFLAASAISGVASDWTVVSEDVPNSKEIVIEASALQADTTVYVELTLKNTTVER